MNKQPTTVRTYLLRGAFLLSLAFVIVMPLALGQTRSRGSKPSVAAAQMPQVAPPSTGAVTHRPSVPALPASQLPKTTSGPAGAHRVQIPPVPQLPQVVLYDQYNNAGFNATSSQDFEPAFDPFDDFTADDFVVPGGQSWSVESVDADGTYDGFTGPALSFHVFFYSDSGGLPGALVATRLAQAYVQVGSTFTVTLSPAVSLTAGTYWVSVQCRMDFGVGGQWYWTDRTVQSNSPAAWQNPGGGFGVCITWGQRGASCGIDAGVPDQVYRLNGTIGGGTPTPTPTPTATPSPTATPCGGTIYNIAGFALGIQTTTTRIYNIATNTWSTGAPIPEPNGLSDHATALWNGIIYVAGGFNGSGATNVLRAYDIASNSWSVLAPMPTAVYLPGFGTINGKLYVASGNTGFGELPDLQIYDIATNTWSTGAPIPTPVTGPGSAVYQGKLYVFGGSAPFPTNTTITQIYDPVANSWSSGPNLNFARLWFYGGAIDDTSIVAPGGDNPPGIPINVNEQLTASWAIKAPVPYNARGPFAVSDGTFVYIGGGYDGSIVHTDTLRYDPVANTYTPLAPAPDAHYLSQAVIVSVPCGTPTPTPTPTPSQIELRARGQRLGPNRKAVELRWIGANPPRVDIFRNGVRIARVPTNPGTYTDTLFSPGLYTYKVCEAGSTNCSNEVTVRGP